MLNRFQLNCIALNHRYSLKGLSRPYVYDPPSLTLAPQRAKITPLISKEEIARRNAECRIPPSRDDQEGNEGRNRHTYIPTYIHIQAKHFKSGMGCWLVKCKESPGLQL